MSERPFKQYTRLGFWTKLQIGVFLIVLLAMFLQYTLPLMSREGRAEKLYIDSWFEGTAFFSWMIELVTDTFLDDDEKHKISISKLEKALELSPGNPVYEQALARQYPPEELPKLLAESKLADKARWLANYRYYLYTARMNSEKMDKVISAECQKPVNERKYHVNGAHVYPDSYWRESLKNLDKLAAVIPECPMIYLHRAVIYSDMMQYEKMMKNIRKANTLDPYDPIWLDRLPQLNSTILAYGEKFIINESYTSKLITYGNNYGNQLLRKGKVDEAIHVYEDLCHFGIRYAQQQPYSIDTITRGAFLFFKSWDNLSPIYKDFDHRDRLKTYSEISGMFLDVYKVASDSFEKSLIYTTHVFDIFFWYSWLLILIIVGIIISTLTWVILGILHKRGKQESFHAAPWNDRWFSLRFLIAYSTFFIIMLIVTKFIPYTSMPTLMLIYSECLRTYDFIYFNIGIVMAFLTQLVVSVFLIRQLRTGYFKKTGDRIGIMRFIFNPPDGVGIWICKSFTRMYLMQLIFFVFILMIGSIYYKATFDFYPWQPERVKIIDTGIREAAVGKASLLLEEASSKLYTHKNR